MHRFAIACAVVSLGALLAAPEARAEEGATEGISHPFFIGGSGGVGWANVDHPKLTSTSFRGATLGLHLGYAITSRWAVGLDLTTLEKTITRTEDEEGMFATGASALHPLAGCNGCRPMPRGGSVVSTTAIFGLVGPRVELTPFGGDGLYAGAGAGIAFLAGLEAGTGLGGTLRAGYRVRLGKVVTFAAEAGFQAQSYADATMSMPYGALVLRPYL